jgi:hypothetical protein
MSTIDTTTVHTMTDRRGAVRHYRLTVTGMWCWCSAPAPDVLDGYLSITGSTYEYREMLKGLGLKWDSRGKRWHGTTTKLDSWYANSVRSGIADGDLLTAPAIPSAPRRSSWLRPDGELSWDC